MTEVVTATSLTVIIPSWCEAHQIANVVRAALEIGSDVIVADAGSPDGTAAVAQAAGARIVSAPRSRGAQLHAGALAAQGDVLLFLHADAMLPREARAAIDEALLDPLVVGGNFFLRFVPDSFAARLFTRANDLRRRWLRIYYGDSGIFVRRTIYTQLGGFRALPILEDYEFVRRLERAGRTVYLRRIVMKASARRFEAAPLRTLLVWTLIQTLYSVFRVSPDRLARYYADIRGRTQVILEKPDEAR